MEQKRVDMEVEEEQQLKVKDFSAEVAVLIPAVQEAVRSGKRSLEDGLKELLTKEKRTRLAADVDSTMKLTEAVVSLCHEKKEWKQLGENITLICKRRAQMKKVVQQIIKLGASWIDDTPDDKTKREYIEVLRTVSAGKMFAELDRARMTRTLAQMDEAEGKIAEAADILQDVQVETIGAMDIREKADFLLEQVRLMLAKKDYVRAEIIANKVNAKVLEKPDLQDLKIKYCKLMVTFHRHSNNYLAICKMYHSMFNTASVQENPEQWKDALGNAVVFLILSPFDSEVSDLLHRMKTEKKMKQLPTCKTALDLFTTAELMRWPLPFAADWQKLDSFSNADDGKEHFNDLRKRVIQHNIRTISQYYDQITSARLAELLSLTVDEAEESLSELVSLKQLWVKIDRPAGIATFSRPETPNVTLNAWAADINELLKRVEKTTHLIHKENMQYKVS